MQDAIAKADVLIEAMAWIRQFRERITVIKLGGSLLDDEDALRHLLIDVIFMESVGMRPVLVHGGGAAISRAMAAAGIEPKFIQGRRVTDDATLAIVKQVLAGEVNRQIAVRIEELGGRAMPLSLGDAPPAAQDAAGAGQNEPNPAPSNVVLFGERLSRLGEDGGEIDLGHVGLVRRVDQMTIENLCYAGQVPVIPSICEGPEGEILNVNADTAAMAVAQALGAEKLVFLSDVNGVRRDKEDPESLVHSLTGTQAREMIDRGQIADGMIPKVEACLDTLHRGVRKIHIIDGRLRHSLLLEIYTNQGVGTEITADR